MTYLPKSETIARWSTFLLFLLIPVFFLPVPWMTVAQGKVLLSTVIVTIGFLAWIAMSLKESESRIPKSPLLVAALLVPLAYLTSALVAGPSWESLVGGGGGQDTVLNFIIWYFALFLSAIVLGGTQGGPVRGLRLLLIGTILVLSVQVIRLAVPSFTFGGAMQFPTSSVIGSWHDLAIYLAVTLFLSLSLLPTNVASGAWRYVSSIVVIGSFALLLIINYTDVWLGLAGAAFLFALLRFRGLSSGSQHVGFRGALMFLVIAGASIGLYFGASLLQRSLPTALQITQVEVRPSWQGTFAIGREVFAKPTQLFFGSGPNTFSREWDRYKPLSVNETQFWDTDFYYGVGFIPTSFVTTGVAGLIAWFFVCAVLLRSLVSVFRHAHTISYVRAVLVLSAVFLTAYHVVYVPGPALSLLTFLILGVMVGEEMLSGAISRARFSLSFQTWRGKVSAIALSLFGLVLLFASVQSMRALISDMFVNHSVITYRVTGDISKSSRSVGRALLVLPGSDRAHRAGVELGLLQFAELAAAADSSQDAQNALQGSLNATIQHGLAAVSIESSDYQNWLTLAKLYSELAGAGVSGAEQQAREAYVEVATKNPTSPLPSFGLAQLDLLRDDDASASTNLEKALSIKPDLAAAHFLLSQIHARAGKLSDALRHASAVVQIVPQDSLGWYNAGTILYASGEYANAVGALERAVSLQENYANALFLLGLSYFRLDRVEDSLRVLRAIAVTNPDDVTLKNVIEKIEGGENPFER